MSSQEISSYINNCFIGRLNIQYFEVKTQMNIMSCSKICLVITNKKHIS